MWGCVTTPYKLVTVYIWQNATSARIAAAFDHFELDTTVCKDHKGQVFVQCKNTNSLHL